MKYSKAKHFLIGISQHAYDASAWENHSVDRWYHVFIVPILCNISKLFGSKRTAAAAAAASFSVSADSAAAAPLARCVVRIVSACNHLV